MRVDESWRSNASESCNSHPRLTGPLVLTYFEFLLVCFGLNVYLFALLDVYNDDSGEFCLNDRILVLSLTEYTLFFSRKRKTKTTKTM